MQNLYHKTNFELFPPILMTYANESYHTPLICGYWAFIWLCSSNVCTTFRHPYICIWCQNLIILYHIQDNAVSIVIPGIVFGFLHLFLLILCVLKPFHVVLRKFLWPQSTKCDAMKIGLYNIGNSLLIKRQVGFIFLVNLVISQWLAVTVVISIQGIQ